MEQQQQLKKKQLTPQEELARRQRQMAVLMVLLTIPVAYFIFLHPALSKRSDLNHQLAVARAGVAREDPQIRGDSATVEAAGIALRPLSDPEIQQRISAAAAATSVIIDSVHPPKVGTGLEVGVTGTGPDIAKFLAALQGDAVFSDGGDLHASEPVLVVSNPHFIAPSVGAPLSGTAVVSPLAEVATGVRSSAGTPVG